MRPPTKFLIAARLMLGQTQAQVGKGTRMATRTVFNLEHGQGSFEAVEKLVAYYGKLGITFSPASKKQGWGMFNSEAVESFDEERNRIRELLGQGTAAEPSADESR